MFEANLHFKINWASLIFGRTFTVFCCVLLCTSPRVAHIWRGNLTEGFLRYEFGGLIFGVAYFRNFIVYNSQSCNKTSSLLVCSRCRSVLSLPCKWVNLPVA